MRVAMLILSLLLGSGLGAQETAPAGSPPSAEGSSASGIAAAIEEARAELARLEAKYDAESRAEAERLQASTREAFELAEREAILRAKLRSLDDTEFDVLEKLDDAKRESTLGEDRLGALNSELRNQALDFEERFSNSLVSLDDPELLPTVAGLRDAETTEDLESRIQQLLVGFERARLSARTASVFTAPVQLGGDGGKIQDCQVLRLGLLGGYYHLAGTEESGLVVVDSEAGGRLIGRSDGLTPSQKSSIGALVTHPADGGPIPFDVTGGAGVASLGTGDSLSRWFEKGGAFMWPLAIVALFAVVVVIERSFSLTFRTRGLDGQIEKTTRLVEEGDLEGAEAYASSIGGPAGRVFRSALTHRDQDRSIVEDAVQEALLHETPTFQKRLAFIALCAAVAPLMGLLGTVTGMIETFKNVTIFGTSDPRFMAGGISVALITTQGGLYLAIPYLLARGLLGSIADGALGRLEAGAMSVVLAILEARDPDFDEPATLEDDAPDDFGDLDDVPEAIGQRSSLPSEASPARGGGGA